MKIILETFWRDLTSICSSPVCLFIVFLLWLFGNSRLSLMLLACLILSYLLAALIRIFYFKKRPIKQKYTGLFEKIDASSFPSVHSMRAAILLVLFVDTYRNVFVIALFGALALLIPISRYILKKHYISDIIWGFIFGILLSGIFVCFF